MLGDSCTRNGLILSQAEASKLNKNSKALTHIWDFSSGHLGWRKAANLGPTVAVRTSDGDGEVEVLLRRRRCRRRRVARRQTTSAELSSTGGGWSGVPRQRHSSRKLEFRKTKTNLRQAAVFWLHAIPPKNNNKKTFDYRWLSKFRMEKNAILRLNWAYSELWDSMTSIRQSKIAPPA